MDIVTITELAKKYNTTYFVIYSKVNKLVFQKYRYSDANKFMANSTFYEELEKELIKANSKYELLTVKDIAAKLDITYSMILIYISSYRFSKYRKGKKYKFTKGFLKDLKSFCKIKKNYGYIKKIERVLNG